MGIFDALNTTVDNRIVNSAVLFCKLIREQLDNAGTSKTAREQLTVMFDNALVRYAEVSRDQPVVQRVIPRIRAEGRRCLMQ